MAIDQASRELGRLAGSLNEFIEYTKASHARMEAKMDAAADARVQLFAELKAVDAEVHTVKHAQRNTEQKIEGMANQVTWMRTRVDQVDASIAEKLDHIVEAADGKLEKAEARIVKLEKWQNNLIGRMSALGAIGALVGGAIGYVVMNWILPLIYRIRS